MSTSERPVLSPTKITIGGILMAVGALLGLLMAVGVSPIHDPWSWIAAVVLMLSGALFALSSRS